MAGSPYGLMRAIMFPGQGSQWVGMGKDLYSASKASKYLFDEADEVLGRNITRVMFDGPKVFGSDSNRVLLTNYGYRMN